MNGKNFAEKLGSIDDIYLDEALEYTSAPRIKSLKTVLVFVAALVCLIAACVVVAANMEIQPKPKKYPTGPDAEKFMNAFGSFYDGYDDEEKTFVLSNEALKLEAEYPEDGGVIIKIVDVDYSVAPFDTHPNIIINGHTVKGAGGAAAPFIGTFDPDTFLGANGFRNTDDGIIKYAVINGTELRIDRMVFVSDEAQDEAYDALGGNTYIPDYDPEDFSSFDSYKAKAAGEGKLLDTAENPIYDTVSILSLVAYNDEGDVCEVIGDWEIEVNY